MKETYTFHNTKENEALYGSLDILSQQLTNFSRQNEKKKKS